MIAGEPQGGQFIAQPECLRRVHQDPHQELFDIASAALAQIHQGLHATRFRYSDRHGKARH
jgi:hypothetical protein